MHLENTTKLRQAARRPHQITVLTTSRCTAACNHCTMRSSPDRQENIPLETVLSVIDQLAANEELQLVNFAGGEPTLSKRVLFDAIASAARLGLRTRLVTNASWAISDASAMRMLRRLRDAGLGELNISADDFHLPYVPIERVVTAWYASRGFGFDSVAIVNCTTKGCVITPAFLLDLLDELMWEVHKETEGHEVYILPSRNGTAYIISSSPTLRLGKATDRIDEEVFLYAPSLDAIDGPCPHAVSALALSPTGKLVACCSTEAENYPALVLGDATVSPVADILAEADKQPILTALSTFGPVALMRFIQRSTDKIAFRERYTSMCEVCEHITSRPEAVQFLLENTTAISDASEVGQGG